MNLALVRKEKFNGMTCDFYQGKNEIWMTRDQIGQALEYADPPVGIRSIHTRHADRLDQFSVVVKMTSTDGKQYNTRVYSARGVYEICRWSRQPKADAFMDFVWDILEVIRTGQVGSNAYTIPFLNDVTKRLDAFIQEAFELNDLQRQNCRLLQEIIDTLAVPDDQEAAGQPVETQPTPVPALTPLGRKRWAKILKLPWQIRDVVDRMIQAGRTYQEVTNYLHERGHLIPLSTVARYGKELLGYRQKTAH